MLPHSLLPTAAMLPLSQSHLTLLDTCPRKYQHVFFDALSGPSTYEQHAKAQWGSQFHLLMQQQALNLPVDVLSTADTEMAESLATLKTAAPEVFAYFSESRVGGNAADPEIASAEHRRTLNFNGYLLTVVYDLVVIAPDAEQKIHKGQIFDWKTYQQPQKKTWLAKDWQTRLYPYVLCETSNLTPDEIAMTYWFVRSGPENSGQEKSEVPFSEVPFKASSFTFAYSAAQHQQTQHDLQTLTDALTRMREQAFFPKVAIEKGLCTQCPFQVRCDRATPDNSMTNPLTSGDSPPLYADLPSLLKAAQQVNADHIKELPL